MRAFLVLIVALFPALWVADIPVFMQQYRQRIGGASTELRTVLRDFDQDAWRSGLSRDNALQLMESKPEAFFRDRASRIKGYAVRLDRLERQEELLRYGSSPLTAIEFYRSYDEQIYNDTRKHYRWGLNADSPWFALMAWLLSILLLGVPSLLFGGKTSSSRG
jgi:hypothetical protein